MRLLILIVFWGVCTPVCAQLGFSHEKLPFPSVRQIIVQDYPQHSPQYLRWLIEHQKNPLKVVPDSLALYMQIIGAFNRLGEPDSVKHYLDRAAQRFPDTAQVWQELAWWEFEQGHYPAAMEIWFQGLEADSIPKEKLLLLQRVFEYAAIQFPIEDPQTPLQGIVGIDQLAQRRELDEIPNFYNFAKADWSRYRDKALRDSLLDYSIITLSELLWQRASDNRLLLEMYGDLLLAKGAGELAALAYLAACQSFTDEGLKKPYEYMATEALLVGQKTGVPYSTKEVKYRLEQMQATALIRQQDISKNQKFWIESGAYPIGEFRKKYLEPQYLQDSPPENRKQHMSLIAKIGQGFTDYLIVDDVRKQEVLSRITAAETEEAKEEPPPTSEEEPILRRTQWILIAVMIGNVLIVALLYRRYATAPSSSKTTS